MSRYYTDPTTGQQVEIKKTHKFRNFVVLPIAGIFVVGGIIGSATGHGGNQSPTVVEAPASTSAPAGSHLEVTGNGQAMVTVSGNGSGMASNTVQLPVNQPLPSGYASVTVTRSPSLSSYQNGGQGDSGTVGCKIVRDGKTVDEKTASGQFASVSCSKFN